MPPLFENGRCYRTHEIRHILRLKANQTIYNWVKIGRQVTRLVNGDPVKTRVKLKAMKPGNFLFLGQELNNFLDEVCKTGFSV